MDKFADDFVSPLLEKNCVKFSCVSLIDGFIYRELHRDGKRCYYKYVFRSLFRLHDQALKFNVEFSLKGRGKMAYRLLNLVFDKDDKAPLYVRQTELINSSGNLCTFYIAHVMLKDAEGIDFFIPLSPVNYYDEAKFNYLVRRWKQKGLLKR